MKLEDGSIFKDGQCNHRGGGVCNNTPPDNKFFCTKHLHNSLKTDDDE